MQAIVHKGKLGQLKLSTLETCKWLESEELSGKFKALHFRQNAGNCGGKLSVTQCHQLASGNALGRVGIFYGEDPGSFT